MMISSFDSPPKNPNHAPLEDNEKTIGLLTINQVDLGSKMDGSPQISECQERHKRYIKYQRAKNNKPPNKEPTSRKTTGSSTKRNLGKDKCFNFYDKGHFAKACPKYRKVKRTSQSSDEMRTAHTPAIDEVEDSPSFFINGKPQPLIIYDYLDKVSSPINESELNRITKLVNKINMITEGINIISKLETPHVKLRIYPSNW